MSDAADILNESEFLSKSGKYRDEKDGNENDRDADRYGSEEERDSSSSYKNGDMSEDDEEGQDGEGDPGSANQEDGDEGAYGDRGPRQVEMNAKPGEATDGGDPGVDLDGDGDSDIDHEATGDALANAIIQKVAAKLGVDPNAGAAAAEEHPTHATAIKFIEALKEMVGHVNGAANPNPDPNGQYPDQGQDPNAQPQAGSRTPAPPPPQPPQAAAGQPPQGKPGQPPNGGPPQQGQGDDEKKGKPPQFGKSMSILDEDGFFFKGGFDEAVDVLIKAKYIKRWRGRDGRYQYEYARGKGNSTRSKIAAQREKAGPQPKAHPMADAIAKMSDEQKEAYVKDASKQIAAAGGLNGDSGDTAESIYEDLYDTASGTSGATFGLPSESSTYSVMVALAFNEKKNAGATPRHTMPAPLSPAANDLVLMANNTRSGQRSSIEANVVRKIAAGKYDPSKAGKLWTYLAESMAREHGKGWNDKYSTADRRAAGEKLAREFEETIKDDSSPYAEHIPKKYKKDWPERLGALGKSETEDPADLLEKAFTETRMRSRSTGSAGPFIGPKGGKWKDAKHTIPWEDDKLKKPGKKAKPSASEFSEVAHGRKPDAAAVAGMKTSPSSVSEFRRSEDSEDPATILEKAMKKSDNGSEKDLTYSGEGGGGDAGPSKDISYKQGANVQDAGDMIGQHGANGGMSEAGEAGASDGGKPGAEDTIPEGGDLSGGKAMLDSGDFKHLSILCAPVSESGPEKNIATGATAEGGLQAEGSDKGTKNDGDGTGVPSHAEKSDAGDYPDLLKANRTENRPRLAPAASTEFTHETVAPEPEVPEVQPLSTGLLVKAVDVALRSAFTTAAQQQALADVASQKIYGDGTDRPDINPGVVGHGDIDAEPIRKSDVVDHAVDMLKGWAGLDERNAEVINRVGLKREYIEGRYDALAFSPERVLLGR